MGLLEPITHKEEINSLIDDAEYTYNDAKDRFEKQKEKTTKQLERLGKAKIDAWSDGMDSFVDSFSAFNNIEVVKNIDTNMRFIGYDENPQQMIVNMQQASLTANELAKAEFAAVGTGALVGIAAYGGAMMFATASTGTAIATLTGAAKTNATLAWFGGGAKAAGGLGKAGGKLVLGGIVAAPVLAVAAVITNAKAEEKLAEAKKINEEAKNAAAQIDTMTTGMVGIEKMSANYTDFIKKLKKKFKPFVNELEKIRSEHPASDGQLIDFNELSPVEQKTLHVSWLMAQIYYHTLSATILTAQGEVSTEAGNVLTASKKEYRQIRKDTFRMTGEEAETANILWKSSANNMLAFGIVADIALIYFAVITFSASVILGILDIIGAIIVFPIFFVYKTLPASKLYVWRLVRLIAGVIFAIVMNILL